MDHGRSESQNFSDDDARRMGEILEIAASEDANSNYLGALTGLSAVANFVDATKTAVVADARAANHTWAEIGDALGISKQTAFNRYANQGDQK